MSIVGTANDNNVKQERNWFMTQKKFLLITALLLFMSFSTTGTLLSRAEKDNNTTQQLNETAHRYASLIDQLISDGFKKADLLSIFNDSRIQFLDEVVKINLINNYVKVDYSHFLNNQSVNHAKQFLSTELPFLTKVERQYQVEKEIVVSILCIESSFGKTTGNHIVFNVFTTLSLLTAPEVLDKAYQQLKINYPQLRFEEIKKRAEKKSKWAYHELKSLLTIAEREKLDVFNVKGSWAGAFGIAQFLPSSYIQYGMDGNNDQKVRLFNKYDSMVSVANYLRKHGWEKGLSEKKKKALIRKYNNSTPYVNTVLELSKKINT